MSLRFSGAGARPVLRCPSAANDNAPAMPGQDFGRRLLLREALRHFAAHGAGAAERARSNAEQAFFAGDRTGYLHWLEICRALDRRLVDAIP